MLRASAGGSKGSRSNGAPAITVGSSAPDQEYEEAASLSPGPMHYSDTLTWHPWLGGVDRRCVGSSFHSIRAASHRANQEVVASKLTGTVAALGAANGRQ